MESAYQTGKLAANRILEREGKEIIHVYGYPEYEISFLSRVIYEVIDKIVKVKNLLGKLITSI